MLTLTDIEAICGPVFDRHRIVERAFVFGSYARGEQDAASDVGICYDAPSAGRPRGLASFGAQGELRRDLESALGLPVDLLATPREETSAFESQRRFAQEVARDMRRIYERQAV